MVAGKDQVDNQDGNDDRLGPRLVAATLVRKVRVDLHQEDAEEENVEYEWGKHEAGKLALNISGVFTIQLSSVLGRIALQPRRVHALAHASPRGKSRTYLKSLDNDGSSGLIGDGRRLAPLGKSVNDGVHCVCLTLNLVVGREG